METIICIIFVLLILVLLILGIFLFGGIVWSITGLVMDEIRGIIAARQYKKMLKLSTGLSWGRPKISSTEPKLHHSCDDIEK